MNARRYFAGFALVIAAVLVAMNLSGREVEVTVTRVSIPETCGGWITERVGGWGRPLGRLVSRASRVRGTGSGGSHSGGDCGSIVTDRGGFAVVGRNSLFLFARPREEIIRALKPGCRYSVAYYGLVTSPQKGDAQDKGLNLPIIYRVNKLLGCGVE